MRPLPKHTLARTDSRGQLKPLKARLTLKQSSRRETRLLTRVLKRAGLVKQDKWAYGSGPETLAGNEDL